MKDSQLPYGSNLKKNPNSDYSISFFSECGPLSLWGSTDWLKQRGICCHGTLLSDPLKKTICVPLPPQLHCIITHTLNKTHTISLLHNNYTFQRLLLGFLKGSLSLHLAQSCFFLCIIFPQYNIRAFVHCVADYQKCEQWARLFFQLPLLVFLLNTKKHILQSGALHKGIDSRRSVM